MQRISAFLLAGAIAASSCGLSVAAVSPQGVMAFDAAYRDFQARVDQGKAAGSMPRLDNPGDAAMLRQIWGVGQVLTPGAATPADLSLLSGVIEKQRAVLAAYRSARPSDPSAKRTPKPASKLAPFDYQDEVVQAHVFLMSVSAAAVPGLNAVLREMPPERLKHEGFKPLQDIRETVTTVLGDSADLLVRSDLKPDNARLLAEAIGGVGLPLLESAPKSARPALKKRLEAGVKVVTGPAQQRYRYVADGAEASPCNFLCAPTDPAQKPPLTPSQANQATPSTAPAAPSKPAR